MLPLDLYASSIFADGKTLGLIEEQMPAFNMCSKLSQLGKALVIEISLIGECFWDKIF